MIGAKNRYMSRIKALRKRRLDRQLSWLNDDNSSALYDNLHQYSKNKIHCSCPMCSAKTRNKGRRLGAAGNYDPSVNYKLSDLKKVQSMKNQEDEYFNTGV